MPDLNELLRWSIANTPSADQTDSPALPADQDAPLSLRFNPASSTANPVGSSALHPSDAQYPVANNAAPSEPAGPPARRSDLTSEMLDLIMGKPDSLVMKEKMEFASDASQLLDDRLSALDDFEMLIEPIDNANNLAVLKLWDPLLALLKSPEPQIVGAACLLIGTATQNNIKAQAAFYIYQSFPLILNVIYPADSTTPLPAATRKSAVNALSSSLKHWPLASAALSENSSAGFSVLKRGVVDPEPVVRRKMAFLIGTLTLQSGEQYEGELPKEIQTQIEEGMKQHEAGGGETLVDGLQREGVYASLLKGLKDTDGSLDFEYEENAWRALARAGERGGLSGAEKADLRSLWGKKSAADREERGLVGEDAEEIARAFA